MPIARDAIDHRQDRGSRAERSNPPGEDRGSLIRYAFLPAGRSGSARMPVPIASLAVPVVAAPSLRVRVFPPRAAPALFPGCMSAPCTTIPMSTIASRAQPKDPTAPLARDFSQLLHRRGLQRTSRRARQNNRIVLLCDSLRSVRGCSPCGTIRRARGGHPGPSFSAHSPFRPQAYVAVPTAPRNPGPRMPGKAMRGMHKCLSASSFSLRKKRRNELSSAATAAATSSPMPRSVPGSSRSHAARQILRLAGTRLSTLLHLST